MKKAELMLIAELMKNSRRSDRDLAKAIGISQPTVTRMRTKLEEEGYIVEYTMIPDLVKLGLSILALTFVKLDRRVTPEEMKKAVEIDKTVALNKESPFLMTFLGMGLGFDAVVMSVHEEYSSYTKMIEELRKFPLFGATADIQSFLVDLKNQLPEYRNLSLSQLAKYFSTVREQKNQEG